MKISGEVCPHHISLTDESIQNFETNFKMNPPLRSQRDIDALLEGIADGTLEILASDHAPHAQFEKEVEFDAAPFGIVGLETELGLFLELLVHRHKTIGLPRLIEMLTVRPAKLLGLKGGTLSLGAPADITLINPSLEWTVDATAFQSASRNTPFDGWKLKGRAVRTIVGWRNRLAARLRRVAAGNIIPQLIERRALGGDHFLDQVTDGDDTAQGIAIDHWQVANPLVGHEAEAVLNCFAWMRRGQFAAHYFADECLAGPFAAQHDFA